ncbi:MAG: M28 family peptidase [Bacteroidales bacterium]|nr:M28 family peptidase [Bacteroidales bacterium]
MKIFLKIVIIFNVLVGFCFVTNAQDKEKTLSRIEVLTSPEYHGRGYVKDGSGKAADYLADQMEEIGLNHFGDDYFQTFTFDVNSFPGKLSVKLDNNKLEPGVDYLIGPATPDVNETFELFLPDSVLLNDTSEFKKLVNRTDFSNKMLVVDYAQTQNVEIKKFYIAVMMRNETFGGVVELIPDELMWAVRTFQQDYPVVKIKRESYIRDAKELSLKVKADFIENFEAKNVIGYIEGEKKDEFFVFSAHYDHLGRMGKKVYIPGAQDNASGTAMVLDIAEYYKKNKPEYSIVFMLFAAEEAGLLGSVHYVLNPMFDLRKVKMVVNLDLVGTGDDGITIVNGANPDYSDIWQKFEKINIEKEYFTTLKARGEASNSDHYPFHAVGIPAVFIYTMGGQTYYHNPKDKPETLTFTGYNALFNLLLNFVDDYE